MARVLSIDYGLKRVGLAVTDPMQIIANSLTTVETPQIFDYLKKYFAAEKVEKVIVGLPKQLNNQPSESMPWVEKFVSDFTKLFPEIPVQYIDERFTSKMAVQAMVQGGMKKKDRQNKAMIDTLSATILLQSYLDSKSF